MLLAGATPAGGTEVDAATPQALKLELHPETFHARGKVVMLAFATYVASQQDPCILWKSGPYTNARNVSKKIMAGRYLR